MMAASGAATRPMARSLSSERAMASSSSSTVRSSVAALSSARRRAARSCTSNRCHRVIGAPSSPAGIARCLDSRAPAQASDLPGNRAGLPSGRVLRGAAPRPGSKYADAMSRTERPQRGPLPWLRHRVTQAADREAQRRDSDPVAALQSARATLDWSLRHRGPDSPMTQDAKGDVAHRLERLGRFDDALALRDEVVTHRRRSVGADDPTRSRRRRCKGSTSIDWVDIPRRCPFSSTSWLPAPAPSGQMTCRRARPWSGWDARCAISGTSPSPAASWKRRWTATPVTVRGRPRTA